MEKEVKTAILNKKVLSWCIYDFAVSSYSSVIAAVIFPVYYANHIVGNHDGLGDLWWGRAIAVSMAVVALISPILGGIADYSGIRKRVLVFFTYLSAIAVFMFSFLKRGDIISGFFLIVLANLCMEAGFVFYNAFLPQITSKNYYGRVSSWGFGIGYMGSILSLIIALFIMEKWSVSFVWISVSLFILIFSLPLFIFLPEDERLEGFFTSSKKGLFLMIANLKKIIKEKELRRFLAGYFFYADGVNTVIVFSSIFAATTLGFKTHELIILFILVQTTALIGSFGLARLSDTRGPKFIIIISLAFWIIITILAYLADSKSAFYMVAGLAGLGLGVIQASSRAFYAYFIPEGYENEYFGIYSLVGKTSAVLGPLIFGTLSKNTGNQRLSILSVSILFSMGLLILSGVKEQKAKID